jgi:GNAT superfamily N-acetyltransferase
MKAGREPAASAPSHLSREQFTERIDMATTSSAALIHPRVGHPRLDGRDAPGRVGDPGHPLTLRALSLDDRAAVRRFLEELSPASRTLRFGRPMPRIEDRLVDCMADGDGFHRIAWGAWAGGALVGIGELVRLSSEPAAAEFALTVTDRWQGRGLGRTLLERLAVAAADAGIQRLAYYVTGSNRRMLRLLDAVGERYRVQGGAVEGFLAVTLLLGTPRPAHAA